MPKEASYFLLLSLLTATPTMAATAPVEDAFFEAKIRPILVEHCYDCHSGSKNKGGLSLETKSGWQKGGDNGPALNPGKPENSLLIKAIHYGDPELAMPPKKKGGKLPAAEIALLEEWVRRGAPDPRVPKEHVGGMDATEARNWWAFQPLPAADTSPSASRIDAFIDAGIQKARLIAAAPADKLTLIRRATFDLTGLPPTEAEVSAFLADTSTAATDKLFDRLLASPHYGEKWGRHWLDLVRYADSLDSRSYDKPGDILDAWRYRDWVVDAFNRDLPYSDFVKHQLAGDILATREWDERKVIATGMYAIGNWGNGDADKEKLHTDIVDDQVDVTARAFLGLSLACARCHDHKFDPFTTGDYYGLAGFFFSSHILDKFASKGAGESLMRIPLLSPEDRRQRDQKIVELATVEKVLKSGLTPFTEIKTQVAGNPKLTAWHGKGADNPSLVINADDQPVAFSTIHLPGRAIAMHPGPKVPASAVWRSPGQGDIRICVKLSDADPNCGDGIRWSIQHGVKTLKTAVMNNATSVDIEELTAHVQPGDIISLIIDPRDNYTCDTTQIEFIIHDERGHTWDLVQSLVGGAKQGQDNLWWLCSGQGATLGQESDQGKALVGRQKTLSAELDKAPYAQGLLEGGIPLTIYAGYHDAPIHRRGRYDQLGEIIPRQFPHRLAATQPKTLTGSGRLELADWLTAPTNPLTARVMVNRLWQHHFGEGLVRTPNNFGKLGVTPTHPELLDWLAAEFIRSGWSVKHMHRLIMGTSAYQRSAHTSAEAHRADPDNLNLSHAFRRRLSAEELRDAMLAVSGQLDLTLGGKAIRDLSNPRRTLYLTTIRSDRSGYQALFDGADPTTIVDRRTEATSAPQSLFLLNHPFTLAQAEKLTQVAQDAAADTPSRIRWLWARAYQRPATTAELALAIRLLGPSPDPRRWQSFCQTLLCSNAFTYVD